MYIISSCLLGHNCKYNGGNNLSDAVVEFCKNKKYIVVCPESAAKLPCPRPPAERQNDGRVVDREGKDVTEAFEKGAELSLGTCMMAADLKGEELEGAILKANSPSCGCGVIYDGTFTGTLIEGDGVFTEKLRRRGIPVITEKDTEEIHAWLLEPTEDTTEK